MTKKLRFLIALLGASYGVAFAAANREIPPVPYYYLLDESNALDQISARTLEALLVEHDRLTGEQFMIAIFDKIDSTTLTEWTHKIFRKWRIGQRGQDNGVLLVISLKNHKVELEVGLGLESVISSAKSKEVLAASIETELRKTSTKSAVKKGTYRILEALSSPLLQSGKADVLLKNTDGDPSSVSGIWIVLFVVGALLLIAVLNEILAREAHFTGNGWFRPSPPLGILYFLSGYFSFLIRRKSKQEIPGGISGNW